MGERQTRDSTAGTKDRFSDLREPNDYETRIINKLVDRSMKRFRAEPGKPPPERMVRFLEHPVPSIPSHIGIQQGDIVTLSDMTYQQVARPAPGKASIVEVLSLEEIERKFRAQFTREVVAQTYRANGLGRFRRMNELDRVKQEVDREIKKEAKG